MFLLFPILYYYLSPYLIIMGASEGIVTGSFIIFGLMFIFSLFLGRAFYGWICPAGKEQELCSLIKDKKFLVGKLHWIKYLIWVPWVLIIIIMFSQAGGIKTINFFYQTFMGFLCIILNLLYYLEFKWGQASQVHILGNHHIYS